MFKPSLILTGDGSHTLHAETIGETYHSRFGALEESEVVYIRSGFRYLKSLKEINLLEIGFGTGLNGLLTALEAHRLNISTHYYAIENNPLPREITSLLNYPAMTGETGPEIWQDIHRAAWDKLVRISPLFELKKIRADALSCFWPEIPELDLVYFDAFSPDKQPEMWDAGLFAAIFAKLNKGGIMVTYSAKGSVRRNLEHTGFKVERLPGPSGKREMLRGLKI